MKQFNFLFQESTQNSNEQNKKKQLRSLEQFKHFCDNLNLIVKDSGETQYHKVVALYILENQNEIRFQYYYKFNPHFYEKYRNIFSALDEYKEKYTITEDGTKDSKLVFFG